MDKRLAVMQLAHNQTPGSEFRRKKSELRVLLWIQPDTTWRSYKHGVCPMTWLFFERASLAPKHTEVTINTSLTSSVMRPFDCTYAISCRCSVVNRGCISSRFRDNGPQTLWGHELDLLRSRDVIDHVANRILIGHLLLVFHWYHSISLSVFKIFDPKYPCARTHTYTDTRRKWFYILSHAMHCIGQTIMTAAEARHFGWLGGLVVTASDLWSRSREFDSRSFHCRVV